MIIKESASYKVFRVCNALFLAFMIAVTLYPMIHILAASFSESTQLMQHTGALLHPLGFSTEAYKMVFQHPMLLRSYGNTIFIVVVGVAVNILLTSLGAYCLSRKGPMFIKPLSMMVVFTMFFSGGLIPFYLTVKELGMLNTRAALIFPVAINTFNLIILRTGFEGVPASLEESATIDGANDFTILFRIILPLAMQNVAVIVLYYAVSHWNAWFNAMIFLTERRDLYPLQLILREILFNNDTNSMMLDLSAGEKGLVGETLKYAVIIVATVPILCIYPFLQRFFVKGVMVGAVKG